MKILSDCIQYDPAWWSSRLGKPTGSMISEVVTLTGKKSESQKKHSFRLAAERISGKPSASYSNEWMTRGHEVEPKARDTFEFITGRTVTQVGMILRDDEQCGMSPDGLLLDDINDPAGLEIICPAEGTHTEFLYRQDIPVKKAQSYFGMYISGYPKWYMMSYHPDFTPLILEVTSSDPGYKIYSKALDLYLQEFIDLVDHIESTIRSRS